MGKKADIKLLDGGKRLDGRKSNEIREIKMEMGNVSRADGSAKVSFGETTSIVSVYGPRNLFPRFLQESNTGILRSKYSMAPFSVDDRKNPAPDRRSTEISKVTRLAFAPTVFLEEFPKTVVDIFVEIIQADGSTRVTGINAASLALAAAGIPMRGLITACSVGKIDGTLVVDLNGIEDNNSEADVAIAMMTSTDEITLLQMDGDLTKKEFMELLNLAKEACGKIHLMQEKTMREVYKPNGGE